MASTKQFNFDECTANLSHGFDNLLDLYAQATDLERSDGLAWYSEAYDGCVRLSSLYGLPLDNVIDCVAACSPLLRWTLNFMAAETLIRHYVSGGLIPNYGYKVNGSKSLRELSRWVAQPDIRANVIGDNKLKALWCLQGHKALSGPKVTAFADNIRRFSDSNAVTVDSHAILAWFGITIAQSVSILPSFYTIVAADYRKVASVVGVSPLECQAIIWIVRRRLSGASEKDASYTV